MKIHILSCIWRRPQVTELFLAGIRRLQNDFDVSGTIVVSTDEDMALVTSLLPSNFEVISYPNNPLSNKFNQGLFHAMKSNWDGLLIMGSDDLLSNEGLGLLISSNKPYVGFGDIHFFSTETREWRYFNHDSTRLIGAGRLIRREVLNLLCNRVTCYFRKDRDIAGVTYKAREPFETTFDVAKYYEGLDYVRDISRPRNKGLWENGLEKGLDNSSELHLAMLGFAPFKIKDEKVHLIDIKTNQNVTNWNKFADCREGNEPNWFMSEEEVNLLNHIKFDQDEA